MNAVLQAFDFESLAVRVVIRGEQPWFVAADVCRVLEHSNSRMAIAGLDDDEKGVSNLYTPGGEQGMNLISESGLYALIFKSRKAEARRFRKWVTSEVLPAIRRDGEYRAAQTAANTERGQLARLRRLLLETAEGVKAGVITPGKAQAIAITGQRYLETLKLEAEAMGYEKVLGLPTGETQGGVLPDGQPGAELLQGLPQREMPAAEDRERDLPEDAGGSEEALGEAQPAPGEAASAGLPATEVVPGERAPGGA